MHSLGITEIYMRQRQKELLDEVQQYRLASQGATERQGVRLFATRAASLIRCRLETWVGRWRQQLGHTRAQPALRGSETPC